MKTSWLVVFMVAVVILGIVGLIGIYSEIKIRFDGPKIEKTIEEGVKKGIEKTPWEKMISIISQRVEKGNVSLQKDVRNIRTDVGNIRTDVRNIRKEIQTMKGEVKGEKEVIVIPGPRKEKVTEKISKETVPVPMEENRIEIPLGDADYVDIAIDNGNTFTLKKVDDYKIFPLSEGKHQVVIVSHKKSFKPIKKIVDVPYLKENEKLKLLAVE